MDTEPAHSISKRGRVGEGRPTLYTPELANRLADHIAAGLTDEEAAALENISCTTWGQAWRAAPTYVTSPFWGFRPALLDVDSFLGKQFGVTLRKKSSRERAGKTLGS
jgi:hypothetical protein